MKKIPKGIPVSKRSIVCSNCGTPIPPVTRIAKILPDVYVVDLFKTIEKHLKKTNKLFERTVVVFKEAMFKARRME
jgi:hypothetical protein